MLAVCVVVKWKYMGSVDSLEVRSQVRRLTPAAASCRSCMRLTVQQGLCRDRVFRRVAHAQCHVRDSCGTCRLGGTSSRRSIILRSVDSHATNRFARPWPGLMNRHRMNPRFPFQDADVNLHQAPLLSGPQKSANVATHTGLAFSPRVCLIDLRKVRTTKLADMLRQ